MNMRSPGQLSNDVCYAYTIALALVTFRKVPLPIIGIPRAFSGDGRGDKTVAFPTRSSLFSSFPSVST